MSISYLTLDEVLVLHNDQLMRYGGRSGIRDMGLLQSALGMPQAGYNGTLLHPTLPEQAAAYLFHISENQAFVDGNKRVGVAAAFMFLWFNGFELTIPDRELYDMAMAISRKQATKADAAVLIARNMQQRP